MGAFQIVDVHDLGIIEDGEVYALVDLLPQVVEIGPRLVRDVHASAHQRAEPEQRDAELILAILAVLLEQPLRHQRDREPVHRALGEPQSARERADAELDLVLRERFEQLDRGRDRGQPLAPTLAPADWFFSGHGSFLATETRAGRLRRSLVPLGGPLFRTI